MAETRICPTCGRSLTEHDDEQEGIAYALGHLRAWHAAQAIDEWSFRRLQAHLEVQQRGETAPKEVPVPQAAPIPAAPSREPAGPGVETRIALALQTFATEQTPSLLLYIGAFLVVVSAFIFVNVSGDQISDLLKVVLMLGGTLGFIGAGMVCHRYARVLSAGRTFLVIGALIAPLDVVAYYVLVARASPLDAPTLWASGSLICATLYAGFRLGGYGTGYSYLFFAASLSSIFGLEALVGLPVAWAAVPFAALAIGMDRAQLLSARPLRTLLGPLAGMTVGVAAFAGLALILPLAGTSALERAALPADAALLNAYFLLRGKGAAEWEEAAAALGPAVTAVAVVFAASGDLALTGLATMFVACVYLLPSVMRSVGRAVQARAPGVEPFVLPIGLGLIAAGVLPIETYATSPISGAIAFGLAAAALTVLAWVWDDRPGPFAAIEGSFFLVPAAAAVLVGYRFALAASGLLPLAVNVFPDLARAYAPLSLAAWASAAMILRRPAHARIAAGAAALLAVTVSTGSYEDAPVHSVVNLLYAAGAAAVGIRLGSRPALWIAGVAALLAATGLYRWSGAPLIWYPAFALGPAAVALAGAAIPRIPRVTLLQIATAAAVVAAVLGYDASQADRLAPWDAEVWRTTMVAVAAAGVIGSLLARQRRSLEQHLAAAVAAPLLVDMFLLSQHPTIPEALTVPFAVYGFVAVWVARRSALKDLRASAPLIEYAAAALAIAPTVARTSDIGSMVISATLSLAFLAAASRWPSAPTARVALAALGWLSVIALFRDPRLDEIRITAGAIVLGLCALTVRRPSMLRLPELRASQLVAAALICVPTGAVTLLAPYASHFDVPVPLLLCIELGALYAVAVVFEWVVLLRALLAASTIASVEFVALASYGEWYAALLGSAMVNAALAVARRWPNGRALREHALLGAMGVGVMFLPSLGDTTRHSALGTSAEVLAGALAVTIAAGVLGERWIAAAALGVVGLESLVVMRDRALLQLPGVAAGAVLLALAIAFPRFRRGGLPRSFSSALDALGVWLYVFPTFLLTFSPAAALQNAVLMAQLLVLTIVGLLFRRRWQIVAAIVTIAIQSLRAILDVIDRIPNWATFAIAGALLLGIGFLWLLKRELFERWQRRFMRWWVAWLATST